MHFKTLSLLFLSATALAASPVQERDLFDLIPEDIGSLISAAPDAIQSRISESPDYGYSLLSSLHYSNPPDWFSELPQGVQDAANSAAHSMTDRYPEPTGETGGNGGSGGDGDDGGEDSAEGASESDNGAPRPTGAVVASLAGAAGILGLAVAL